MLDCAATASILKKWDKLTILCHASPDGDTLGCAAALANALVLMGKRVRIRCADEIPPKFDYLFEGLEDDGACAGDDRHVMTVDVADIKLLGGLADEYKDKIELAIDHHGTHRAFCEDRWVNPQSAAACEMIWLLIKELGVSPTKEMASCVYTGITTDTGCFRYRNVTPETMRIAAETMEYGADAGSINQKMFESKSRARLKAESLVMSGMEFFCGGRAAMVYVPQSIYAETGAGEDDLDAVPSLTRQIEGVLLGITVKEKKNGEIKLSVRANPPADAAQLCAKFGGGGHTGAAGCSFYNIDMKEAAAAFRAVCEEYVNGLETIL